MYNRKSFQTEENTLSARFTSRSTAWFTFRVLLLLIVFLLCPATSLASHNSTNSITLQSGIQPHDSNLEKHGSHVAIVVGVSQYRRQQNGIDRLPTVPYAVNDATLLSSVLSQSGYRVITLKDFQGDKQFILDIIADLAVPDKNKDSSLVFAFSGHGFNRDGINYIALGNTDMSRVEDTALSVKQLKLVLSQTGFRQRILLIDACRNTPTRSAPGLDARFLPDIDPKGTAVMYSTAAGALAYEDSSIKHGVFSYYVARGLEGNAADDRGAITFDSLFDYVSHHVSNHVLGLFNRPQMPYIAGERNGKFTLISESARNRYSQDQQSETTDNRKSSNANSQKNTKKKWRLVTIGIGAIVAGILLAGASSTSNDQSESDPITLVIPTP